MNEFIIVFRECLEASLIVGIIYTILAKSNLRDAIQKLWLGVAASIVASLGVAYVVISLKDALGNNSSMALFVAIFMYITAGLIWYVVFWLSKHVSDRKVLEGQTMTAVKISSWGVFFVTFFAILREGFETVVFLISSFSITESFSYVGFIVGAALAILLGYLVVVQGKRINLKRFFQGTTLLLVFLASGMVAYGTHEVESYLVKSNQLNKDNIFVKNQGYSVKHKIKSGESLSDILKKYYGNSGLNMRIVEVSLIEINKHAFVRKNPNYMFAGKTLVIPSIDHIMNLVKNSKNFSSTQSSQRLTGALGASWAGSLLLVLLGTRVLVRGADGALPPRAVSSTNVCTIECKSSQELTTQGIHLHYGIGGMVTGIL